MRFSLSLLPVVAVVVGCASNSAAPPTVAPVVEPVTVEPVDSAPTSAPTIAASAADAAYIANATKARQMVPFKLPLEVGGAKIPFATALDSVLLQTAKARHTLRAVPPPARFALPHGIFEPALDDMYESTKAARSAVNARDEGGFNRANGARIEASKHVNMASEQYTAAMK